ncbi:hypothetical protein ACLX1H_008971 [Fusarium chlamydosporum]
MNSNSGNLYAGKILDRDDSFRLISLDPGHSESPLTLRLFNTSLHDAPPYEAVSYVWGDASKAASVEALNDGETVAAQIAVTYNCHEALRRLRRPASSRILWIDSICIDQASPTEKNHQLNLMVKIYQMASQVLIYLGEGSDVTEVAMEFISQLDRPSDYGERSTVPEMSNTILDVRAAVGCLFELPWFYRVWVLQEVVFAQKATVICGDHDLEWESFMEFYHSNIGNRWVEKLPYSVVYAASWKNYVPYLAYGERLLKALRDTRFCGATDPRDRLYAILPLIDREHEEMRSANELLKLRWELDEKEIHELDMRQQFLRIQPNYNNSTKQVYTDLAVMLLQVVGLDLLTYVISDPSIPGLSSWVPDWTTHSPYWAAKAPRVPRHKPFAGFPEGPSQFIWGWKALYPHLINTWTCSLYTRNDETSTQLHTRGISIGKIVRLGDLCDIGNDYFPIGQWTSILPDSSYLRSRDTSDDDDGGADSWPQGDTLSPFATTLAMNDVVYPKAVNDVITYIRRYNGETTEENEDEYNSFGTPSRDDNKGIPLKERFAHGASYDKQALWILKHCDGKRLIILDDGSIGLAPDRAKVGDELFVIEGASTPFALRSLDNRINNQNSPLPSDPETEYYRLVGEAFVLNFMDGEIWDFVEKDTKPVKT